MARRAVLALVVALTLAAPGASPAGTSPAAVAAQTGDDAPLDLAWAATVPADAPEPGYGFVLGADRTLAAYATEVLNGRDAQAALATDLDEAGWQRSYYARLGLPSEEDPDNYARSIETSLAAYADTDGAARGLAGVAAGYEGDTSVVRATTDPKVGDEAVLLRREGTTASGARFENARVLFRDGPVVAEVELVNWADDAPPTSEVVALAVAVVDRLGKTRAGQALDLSLQVPRLAGEGIVDRFDHYQRRGGDQVPIYNQSPGALQSRDEDQDRRGVTDRYYYEATLPNPEEPEQPTIYAGDLLRLEDEEAAATYLQETNQRFAESPPAGFSDVAPVEDAGTFGDESATLSYVPQETPGTTRNAYTTRVRVGDHVAVVDLQGVPDVPLAAAEELAQVATDCLAAGGCPERVAPPPALAGDEEADREADETPAVEEETPTTEAEETPPAEDDEEAAPVGEDEDAPAAAGDGSTGKATETPEPDDLATATANEDASEATYQSPRYGYGLTYDPTVWEVTQEDDDPDDSYDRVTFSNGTSVITLVGDPDYAEDALDRCLDDYAGGLADADGVADVAPQTGENDSGTDGDRAFATYAFTFTTQAGESFERIRYNECRWLGDGATLVVLHSAPAAAYADEIAAREDLLTGLATAGEPPSTAEAPAPEKTPPPAEEDARAAADAASFSSDDFGYSITWDADRWHLVGDPPSAGSERLELTNGTGTVVITPFAQDATERPSDCVDGLAAGLDDPEDGERTELTDEFGHHIYGFAPMRAYAAYQTTGGASPDRVRHIECRALGDGDQLAIVQIVPPADYDEGQIAARQELLAGLTIDAHRSDELPGEAVPIEGAAHPHIDPGEPHAPYTTTPPTFGANFAEWAAWGVHAEPIPDGNQIHNLEHGGIVLLYSCDCPETVALLERFADPATGYPTLVIAAPYPEMDAEVALTAWGRILEIDADEVTEDVVRGFIEAFIDQGPEQVETATLDALRESDAPKP